MGVDILLNLKKHTAVSGPVRPAGDNSMGDCPRHCRRLSILVPPGGSVLLHPAPHPPSC
jgi:hypothetical protein